MSIDNFPIEAVAFILLWIILLGSFKLIGLGISWWVVCIPIEFVLLALCVIVIRALIKPKHKEENK